MASKNTLVPESEAPAKTEITGAAVLMENEDWSELAELAANALESIDKFRREIEAYCVHSQMPGEMDEVMTDFASMRQAIIQTKMMQQLQTVVNDPNSKSRPKDDASGDGESTDFQVLNPHIHRQYESGQSEYLYHLDLMVSSAHSPKMFHDVQFVCVGGTPSRMYTFATYCLDLLKICAPVGLGVADICGPHARYVLYKVGPVLIASHGIGNSSISILLNELFKLLHYGKARRAIRFIRIGTSCGVGVRPGTTVITQQVYNVLFQNFYEQHILGHAVLRPALLDQDMCQDLLFHGSNLHLRFPVVMGNTLCTSGYYEEQARLDGAFCDFSHLERLKFLQDCDKVYGIRNIEMEALSFAALTSHADVKAAVVSVVLQNSLADDKLTAETAENNLVEWESRPQKLVGEYIKHELRKSIEARFKQAGRQQVANDSRRASAKKATLPSKPAAEPVSADMLRLKVLKQELDKVADKVRTRTRSAVLPKVEKKS